MVKEPKIPPCPHCGEIGDPHYHIGLREKDKVRFCTAYCRNCELRYAQLTAFTRRTGKRKPRYEWIMN